MADFSADYPDPYDFINVLLDGKTIRETENVNIAYFDVAYWNRRMARAAVLPVGPRRYRAYALLDRDLMRRAAPWAPLAVMNAQTFTSSRVRHFARNPVYGIDLAAMRLR